MPTFALALAHITFLKHDLEQGTLDLLRTRSWLE
jgi:hypothetical protein